MSPLHTCRTVKKQKTKHTWTSFLKREREKEHCCQVHPDRNKWTALRVPHLSECGAQANAASRGRHVTSRMLMLEVTKQIPKRPARLSSPCATRSLRAVPRSAQTAGQDYIKKKKDLGGSGGPFEIQKLPQSHVLSWSWGWEGEEEEGRQGQRPGPPSGQRRCDCSRPSNCCHTLSMGNIGSKRGTERG